MARLFLERALLPGGWHEGVVATISEAGLIEAVEEGATPGHADEVVRGASVPGMSNLHSHAFQRAMAGLAERAGPAGDSFWTWRQVMYDFLPRVGPEELEAIAGQLYVEMLKAGYTAVGEFHYLHHAPDGTPYANLTEMSARVIEAAGQAGIAITHLPVLYAHGGFGAAPPAEGQKRFLNDLDRFCRLVTEIHGLYAGTPGVSVGIAPHSLRAVSRELLSDAVAMLDGLDPSAPIHIHIAEQLKEVEDCVAWSGKRPVEWLLENADVKDRWCLVHATHMTAEETRALAASGAVAGLCPTTEANLGDGLFPAAAYLAAGGRLGIGSDSHISVDLAEEIRLLEYGQRLKHLGRNLLADAEGASTGRSLYDRALQGGAAALGLASGRIAPGFRADLVVLDSDHPSLYGREGDSLLDAWLFFNAGNPIRDVYVAGRRVVTDGVHHREEEIAKRYRQTIARLRA